MSFTKPTCKNCTEILNKLTDTFLMHSEPQILQLLTASTLNTKQKLKLQYVTLRLQRLKLTKVGLHFNAITNA